MAVRGVTDGSTGSVAVVAVDTAEVSEDEEAHRMSSSSRASSLRLRFRRRLFTSDSTSAFIRFKDAGGRVPVHIKSLPKTHTLSPHSDSHEYGRKMARNYEFLRNEHNIAGLDDRIVFDEDKHAYHVDGQKVPKSVTGFVKDVSGDDFNGPLIIEKNLASWRAKTNSKYFATIDGLNDEEAKAAILSEWNGAGRLGTALHKRMEGLLNGMPDVADNETDPEFAAARDYVAGMTGLTPLRTELSLFYERGNGTVPCAGQADALFVDEENELVIVDFKRTDKDLTAAAKPFKGKRCKAPLEGYYANENTKYSLQQSFYSVMIEQRMGIPVPPNKRFLLKIPPGGGVCELIRCAVFDEQAKALLEGA